MMPPSKNDIKRIEKVQLNVCSFVKSQGYSTDCDLRERSRKLHLSMLLSKSPKSNVKIVFNTIEGYNEVLTEIWGATEQFVLLKDGRDIPVESIAYVTLE
ncbi:MAG: hypothetical protein JWO06_1934 [Bacteroidota bacterium]|nr:hypothetical protein [Bacteroidota bacterium]